MIVVADTSPINYLILIRQINLLQQLYAQILIPSAVLKELKHPAAPKNVRDWATDAPPWVEVLDPKTKVALPRLETGESDAIALATEIHAQLILMDDYAGRKEASRKGLKVAGTLSVLDEADQAGLLSFEAAVAELQKTTFRLSPMVLSGIRRKRTH
jgi:predicted nucleic acid-binding protein